MIGDAQTTKKLAKETFEAWAGTYDHSLMNHFLFLPSCYTFLEELARCQTDREDPFDILDVGCGTGTFAAMLSGSNLRTGCIVGLDYVMEMCRRAQDKASSLASDQRVRFLYGDSEHLPFEDGSFDIVTCANSFHHYPHQQAVVREMRRVLRPGGRLMIIDGFRDNVIGWVVFDIIITALEKAVYHAPWKVMRSYFESAGFENITHRKFNLLFPAFVTVGEAKVG